MKYYVRVLDSQMVVSAESEIDACLKCSKIHGIVSVGLTWTVSEKGFDAHSDDVLIQDDLLFSPLEDGEDESF